MSRTEEQLLAKQIWVTCLSSDATEPAVLAEFSRYGTICQVQLRRAAAQHSGGLLNGSNRLGKPPPKPRAVIEYEDASGAAAVLAARRHVDIFSGRNGVRSSSVQLVLPSGSVGHLKQPCSCRYRVPCTCPGYVK